MTCFVQPGLAMNDALFQCPFRGEDAAHSAQPAFLDTLSNWRMTFRHNLRELSGLLGYKD